MTQQQPYPDMGTAVFFILPNAWQHTVETQHARLYDDGDPYKLGMGRMQQNDSRIRYAR